MINNKFFTDDFQKKAFYMVAFLLICRLITMYCQPLLDSTEARYAEIARIMLETGNWVTPMHEYGVPFWAKPPLSTWLAAFSMKLFGVNEWAPRLPGFLLSVGVLALTGAFAKKQGNSFSATLSVLVLTGCFYFLLNAGTVMTDPALLFCTTLIMVGFWQSVVGQEKIWGYLFFIGLGLGMLAKGPIALVLTGLPIFIWVILQKRWSLLWQNLPWIKGTLLMLAIFLPWYLLAESRTPGFINYFIIGEHFNRFLQPAWHGDKYGFAHPFPYGTIWLYALMGISPWSLAIVVWLTNHFKDVPKLIKDDNGLILYLSLFMLVPLVFFTFATNIIYPYVFPCLPAFALLFAEMARRSHITHDAKKGVLRLSIISGIIFLVASGIFILKPDLIAKSQKPVVAAWRKQQPLPTNHLIYWSYNTFYSAKFYSEGKAKATLDPTELLSLMNEGNYLVIKANEAEKIPPNLLSQLIEVDAVKVLKNHYILYRMHV